MRQVSQMLTSEEVNRMHLNSDKDAGAGALHHTLGQNPSQASPGSHRHDGRDSKRIELKNLAGSDVTYNPGGGTTGTQPTFSGTPLFTGSYTKWGNMCHFAFDVDMDNILTFGTGQYYITLPFKAKRNYQFSDGCLHDISASRDYPIFGHVLQNSDQLLLKSIDAQGNSAYNVPFTFNTPVTLATTDNFHIAGTYEIAE
jgi:hypothetical protein